MYTELEEISPELKKAILFKEDRFFNWHFGVNPLAVLRAAWKNTVSGERTSGASTITMQVARMMDPKPRTYWNKLEEMFRALQLELMYSKEEIFQLYLNLVPYGGNIEGVKSASILYFGKNPDHLSLAEITVLSIIPNRPESWRIGVYDQALIEARDHWLRQFDDAGLFKAEVIDDALSEPLSANRREGPKNIPQLATRLFFEHPDEPIIRTWIDMEMQKSIETLVYQYVQDIYFQGIKNAAVMVIDNRENRIVAYVGSADFENREDGGQVDGIRAIRQPGSTLKPFLYAMAIDRGLVTPKSVLVDAPVNFKGYAPENFDESYRGYVSVENSLSQSLNVTAVKLLNDMGLKEFIDMLALAGFETIELRRDNLGLSTILGGCGVQLEELAILYSSLAHGGTLIRPSLWQDQQPDSSLDLFSEEATWMVANILTQANRPDFPAHWESSLHMPKVAWKTGTSYGRRDAWSVGFNKNFTIAVWVGNFSGSSVQELTGAEMATPLLFKIFNLIDFDAQDEWLNKPHNLSARIVCTHSGLSPGPQCQSQTSDFYLPMISNSDQCNHMIEVQVSANDSISYCQSCLPELGYKTKWFENHPQEIISLYREKAIPYQAIPPHNPECERLNSSGAPTITSPVPGVEYLLDREDEAELKLSCQVTADVKQVHWYINDHYYSSVGPDEDLFFTPPEGTVKISCSDDQGRNSDIKIDVSYLNF
jgi:penicillin-binding protein 1C